MQGDEKLIIKFMWPYVYDPYVLVTTIVCCTVKQSVLVSFPTIRYDQAGNGYLTTQEFLQVSPYIDKPFTS